MAAKALNFKLSEEEINDIKEIASVFNMTMTDVIREAVAEYIAKMKNDPYYRLTANIPDASPEETAEILAAVESLSDDDLKIIHSETITISEGTA